MERRNTRQKLALAVVVGGLVGFVMAPPLATAHRGGLHTELHNGATPRAANVTGGRVHTQLRHAPGGGAANVTGGRLHTFNRGGFISLDGGFVETFTLTTVIGSGEGEGQPCISDGVLAGVSATGSGTIEIRDGVTLLWEADVEGTVETMLGGREITFDGPLDVDVPEGVVSWIVYGFCFAGEGASAQEMEEMREQARRARGLG